MDFELWWPIALLDRTFWESALFTFYGKTQRQLQCLTSCWLNCPVSMSYLLLKSIMCLITIRTYIWKVDGLIHSQTLAAPSSVPQESHYGSLHLLLMCHDMMEHGTNALATQIRWVSNMLTTPSFIEKFKMRVTELPCRRQSMAYLNGPSEIDWS